MQLWETRIHEARILASMIAEPGRADEALLEAWVADVDSRDVCDQVCKNFFARCAGTRERAVRWCGREDEFVRRARFALVCEMAIHHKEVPDDVFLPYFDKIRKYATDDSEFCEKAVDWALREVVKRQCGIRSAYLSLADELAAAGMAAARWIGRDRNSEKI